MTQYKQEADFEGIEHEFGKGRRWIEKWKEMNEWRRKD